LHLHLTIPEIDVPSLSFDSTDHLDNAAAFDNQNTSRFQSNPHEFGRSNLSSRGRGFSPGRGNSFGGRGTSPYKTSPDQRKTPPSTFTCFICGKQNHRAINCNLAKMVLAQLRSKGEKAPDSMLSDSANHLRIKKLVSELLKKRSKVLQAQASSSPEFTVNVALALDELASMDLDDPATLQHFSSEQMEQDQEQEEEKDYYQENFNQLYNPSSDEQSSS
jgi:hypothetical protein